jgi:phosphoenolpyruvate carboxylase
MPDTTDDIAEGISFQAFEDDCRLLHDVLLRELGPRFIHILERNRILAQVYIYNHLTIVALSSYLDIA